MTKFVKSVEYIKYVHDELYALLTTELKQYVSNPEIIPANFTIHYEKIIDTNVTVKFFLINGILNTKMTGIYKNKKPPVLNYKFKIMSDVELASGLFKVTIIA